MGNTDADDAQGLEGEHEPASAAGAQAGNGEPSGSRCRHHHHHHHHNDHHGHHHHHHLPGANSGPQHQQEDEGGDVKAGCGKPAASNRYTRHTYTHTHRYT